MSLIGIWRRLEILIGGRVGQPDNELAELSLELVKENLELRKQLEAYQETVKASGVPIQSYEDLRIALLDVSWLQEIVAGRTSMVPIFTAIQTRHPEVLLRVTQEVRRYLEEIETQSAREPERPSRIQ
jgi:hypothetical protein